MPEQHPDIDSFVIRFIRTADAGPGLRLRGSIRHLQSDETCVFADWHEVEGFIRRFIPLDADRPDAGLSSAPQPDLH